MGDKGAKSGQSAANTVEQALADFRPLGDVTSRKMFGGYGIFESGAMFALVNSQGELFLKADDSNRDQFEQSGSGQHGKMPYFQIPAEVWAEEETLREWARISIKIAHASKKK